MKKTLTFSEKLKSYSLVTGSLLAASAVQGQVIYTDVNPNVQLGGAPPAHLPDTVSHALDLNNDGIVDFNVTLRLDGIDTKRGGYLFSEYINGASHSNNFIGTHTVAYHPFVFQFKAGDSINLTPNNEAQAAIFSYQSVYGIPTYGWKNIKDRYVGVKFIGSDDSTHYAWIRLDVNTNDSVPNIIIKDYAYEETPDKKIAAGQGLINAVKSVNNQNQVSVFPNPSSGNCFIKFEKPMAETIYLTVKNELGKEIYSNQIKPNGNVLPLNFSNFVPGIYYITLKSETISLTEKWIRN